MDILIIGNGVMAKNLFLEIKKTSHNVVGTLDYINESTFKTFNDINVNVDVVIDFSNHIMINDILDFCILKNIPLVIATTGHTENEIKKINESSNIIPILKATNMSYGVTVLNNIVEKMAEYLNDFDIEIIEKHHNRKLDAPSGTAITLYERIKKVKNKLFPVYNRENKKEKRDINEIGIHSIRAGNIVGEHSVIFSKGDEIIEIKHTALSRSIFSVGSIKAAEFIVKKEKGLYKMEDLL